MPKRAITITAMVLNESAGRPVALTIVESASVKKVKLAINPVTIPSGLFLPSAVELERTIGRIGKIHGERIVINPPMNEKRISNSIR